MLRTKVHSCTNDVQRQSAPCGGNGAYLHWSKWSPCSQSCYGGKRSRSRSHTCLPGLDVETETCGSAGGYSQWLVKFIIENSNKKL